ncbi:hypothetical protein AB672_10950 [Xylella taiwanensis]|nr:hypothetical protein AB672_10950 [Xylella taiwanensis]
MCGYGERVNVVSGTALAAMVLAYPHLRTAPIQVLHNVAAVPADDVVGLQRVAAFAHLFFRAPVSKGRRFEQRFYLRTTRS